MRIDSVSSLATLREFFPDQIAIPLPLVARVLGIAEQTARNQVSAGKFPIPTFLQGPLRFALITDIAAHLDAKRAGADGLKTRRGRPTKAEQIARRQAAGGAK